MADATLVQILDSWDEFPVEDGSLLLVESSVAHDEVKEFSSIRMLHDHEQFFLSFNDLVELDNIWMSDLFEDFDLSRDSLNILLVVDLLFFEDLDCNLFTKRGRIRIYFCQTIRMKDKIPCLSLSSVFVFVSTLNSKWICKEKMT